MRKRKPITLASDNTTTGTPRTRVSLTLPLIGIKRLTVIPAGLHITMSYAHDGWV